MSRPRGSRAVSASDLAIVSGQLARPARDVTGIAVRCPFGRPAVIETSARLEGKPNPTLLYLTCPSATIAISREEASGGVRRLKSFCGSDANLADALDEVTRAYRARRDRLPGSGDLRPGAGIGGPVGPERASCLHAYAAALLAALAGWLDPEPPAQPSREPPAQPPREPGALSPSEAAAEAWDSLFPDRGLLWCTDDRCARWAAREIAAAIDVGTISVRLLVADVRSRIPEQIVRRAEVTRLGEGLRAGSRLAEAAADRTRAVVTSYVHEARRAGAGFILVAGTSAARDAVDGREFIRALGEDNEVQAVVLSGQEEAALAFAGASLDVGGDAVVLDVGGGSTELIRRAADGGIEAVSLDLGASRATERWIRTDPPSPQELAKVDREALRAMETLRSPFGAGPARLVGVAGTVTTLACLDAGLRAYRSEAIHLRRLSLTSVDRLISLLTGMTLAERAALPCVQPGRAPVIVGGALIVRAAMAALGYEELTVSERDLLDGLVLAAPC